MEHRQVIVVYGGSFNPPLNSHFSIAQNVLNQFDEVKKIVFIPVNKNYPKDALIENEHRYNMLKAVAEKNSSFIVSDMDMYGDKSLPTINTLEKIQREFPNYKVWLLLGSDNLKDLHNWDNYEDLISKYKVLAMEREIDSIEDIINNDALLKKFRNNIIKLNQEIRSNYSSTYVRNLLKNKKSVKYLLPDEVYDYIEKNNLYRG